MKLSVLFVSLLLLSGCYSLDQNEFCPFGKGSRQETDYKHPIIVDASDNKVSKQEQKSLLKSAHLFSSTMINDTYDIAEYLCTNKGLTIEQYQRLHEIALTYVNSGAVFPWTWTKNCMVQQNSLHQALEENEAGRIITATLCVVGLCTRTEHETFCKNKERTYLENKKLTDKLTDYYLAQKAYKLTYPNTKNVTYCEGPKW